MLDRFRLPTDDWVIASEAKQSGPKGHREGKARGDLVRLLRPFGSRNDVKALLLAMTMGTLILASPLFAFDHTSFDRLLRRYVNDDGLVDYQGIRTNALTDLDAYLQRLAAANPKGWPYTEKLAFWINAYNANMIRHILNNPSLKKVSDRFDLFDRPLNVAGGRYTLNDIEHRIIRGKLNAKSKKGPIPGVTLEKFDPRVHFALVCAAIDCPKLQNFAYTTDNVEPTLQAAAVRFANLPKHLRVEKGRLRISSLMKWYTEDFKEGGGVAAYLGRLIDPAKRPDAEEIKRLLAAKLDQADYQYDWTVNDIRNAKSW